MIVMFATHLSISDVYCITIRYNRHIPYPNGMYSKYNMACFSSLYFNITHLLCWFSEAQPWMSSWMLMYLGNEGTCWMSIQWRLNGNLDSVRLWISCLESDCYSYPGTWQFGQPELCCEAYAQAFGNADKCLGKRDTKRSDPHKFHQTPWPWIDRHIQVAPLWSYARPITLSLDINQVHEFLETPKAFETSLQSNHSIAAEQMQRWCAPATVVCCRNWHRFLE